MYSLSLNIQALNWSHDPHLQQHVDLLTNLPTTFTEITLFVVVFVVSLCPNDNWIRFHFLSQNYFILYYISVSIYLEVLKMWTFMYIYPWHITNVTQSPGYWIWTNLNKILCDSIFSNLLLSWAVATDRKFYSKSDDPPWHIQEYPKLCVFYTGALTTISMSKQTQNYIYLYTACLPKFSVKRSNDTHWCE